MDFRSGLSSPAARHVGVKVSNTRHATRMRMPQNVATL
jgi:hypothetical protein